MPSISPDTGTPAYITVKDAAGTERPATQFYVSKRQVNYRIPPGTATGPATVTITSAAGTLRRPQEILPVAPGLYYAGANLTAANAVIFRDGKVESIGRTVTSDAFGELTLAPIDLSASADRVFLELYGTGLRHRRSPAVVNIGGAILTATYAGAQGTYTGEDQINVEIPHNLKGAGVVDVLVTVDGQTTNPVRISIL